jgi:hypothetical protein
VLAALARVLDVLPADAPHRDEYVRTFREMAAAILPRQRPDGFLGYVQGTGKQPSDGQPVIYDKVPDYEDFGTGCFLLAGTEAWKLAGGVPAQ